MKKLKYCVLIPARGGSKGILNKNIVEIGGMPLIAWTILAAKKVFPDNAIFVSTDSEEIMRIANEYGANTPFLRPAEISSDTASTESVALHFLKWMDERGLDLDSLVLMQATSPVRMAHSLSEAIKLYESESADSLVTVCKTHKFIWRNLKSPEASYDIYRRPRRQDINQSDEIFFENGSFYITKTAIYKNLKNRLGGKIVMYQMTEEESFEIDESFHLSINQVLLGRSIENDFD